MKKGRQVFVLFLPHKTSFTHPSPSSWYCVGGTKVRQNPYPNRSLLASSLGSTSYECWSDGSTINFPYTYNSPWFNVVACHPSSACWKTFHRCFSVVIMSFLTFARNMGEFESEPVEGGRRKSMPRSVSRSALQRSIIHDNLVAQLHDGKASRNWEVINKRSVKLVGNLRWCRREEEKLELKYSHAINWYADWIAHYSLFSGRKYVECILIYLAVELHTGRTHNKRILKYEESFQ